LKGVGWRLCRSELAADLISGMEVLAVRDKRLRSVSPVIPLVHYVRCRRGTRMDNAADEKLAARLSSLDFEIRELRRRVNIAMGLFVGSLFVFFAVVADTSWRSMHKPLHVPSITTEYLVVRSPKSGASLSLGPNAFGRPAIGFLDEKGASKITIGTGKEGQPNLSFFDVSGVFRGGFGVVSENGRVESGVSFNNSKGQTQLALGISGEDIPSVLLMDKTGQTRAAIQITADAIARIQLISPTAGAFRGINIEHKVGADPTIEISNAGGQVIRIPSKR
jgi:hypothetical protein